MKFRVFTSLPAAEAAETAVALAMGLGGPGQATLRWAEIAALTDGRFAFPSPDDVGEELDPALFGGVE